MKKTFKHLSYEERIKIALLLEQGYGVRGIGRILGRHHSCISYELKHKKVNDEYIAIKAHQKSYWKRYVCKRDCMKASLDQKISSFVEEKIKEKWSPERISGYLKTKEISISTKAIYKYVSSRCLEHYLFWKRTHRKGGPKKKRYGKATDGRKYIEERPLVVSSGHWEGDLIVSSHNSCSLLVLVDRYTRKTLIRKLPNRKHAVVLRAFKEILSNYPVRTITLDNDISFNCWRKLEMFLSCLVFFCHPFHSWEKGLVENTNRWIRCWVKKKRDIRTVTKEELYDIQSFLNTVPRKCLGFKTADELLLKEMQVAKLGG